MSFIFFYFLLDSYARLLTHLVSVYRDEGVKGAGYYLKDERLPALKKRKLVQCDGNKQNKFIAPGRVFSDDPERAKLEKLGWDGDLIEMSLRLAHHGDEGGKAREINGREVAENNENEPEKKSEKKYAHPEECDSVPLSQLNTAPFPSHVDPAQRELYLSDEEFDSLLKVKKVKWKELPSWKRQSLKKKNGLF